VPTEGHYAGATAQGTPISFDVVGGGSEVTNVVAVFSTPPEGRAAVLTITRRLSVDAHGEWGADVNGAVFGGRIAGTLGPDGTARGSLDVDASGPIGWEARCVTAVLPDTG
jgi:hypothetical protein